MKNADSLSAIKAKLRYDVPDRDKVYFSPKITDREKTIPEIDAIDALRNAAYEDILSFLLNIMDNAAPII